MEKLVENIVYWIREWKKGVEMPPRALEPENVINEQRMCDVLGSTIFRGLIL